MTNEQIAELVSEDGCWVNRGVFANPSFYGLEKRHTFGRSWLFLTHDSQIPEPGDFVQAYMGETPVIVACGKERQIHVSINSCIHRGLPGGPGQCPELHPPLSQLGFLGGGKPDRRAAGAQGQGQARQEPAGAEEGAPRRKGAKHRKARGHPRLERGDRAFVGDLLLRRVRTATVGFGSIGCKRSY